MPLDRIPSMATTKDARYRAKQDVAEQNEDQTLVEILTKRDQLETVQCTYYQTEEMSNTSADSDSSSSSGQALGLVETGSSTCTDQPRETVMQTAQRNNNAQEELLIQALENEQQYEDTPSDEGCPPVPTEVSHGLRQPSGDTDVETCVSSVTDGLQDADLFVDHMYPTLNTVVEEEESHSNLALKSLNDNSNRSRASSTTTTGETQQQQASQNQQHYEMSLNKTESKEELQRNEAAVPKAAKMDKRDQASPAAIIVGIGSRTTSALLVDKSDNQQDDQKDLQGKPEALRPKENASGTINPQEPAPDPQQPVSTPGAHSIDGPGSNSAIDTTDGRILQVPPSTTAPMDNTEIIDRQLMAQLSQLKELILFRNGLTGTLPTELGLMTNLTDVSVLANAVTGTIPTELGRLTLLTSLHLASNSLEGTLPSELWLLTSLESLVAGHYPVGNAVGNYLTGQLPSEIGTMTSLRQLSFSRNLFTGEIPSEYGLLISLQSMFLFDNFLSGGLPSEVGMMTLLKYLMVQGNMLSGLFPNELQELAALQWLTLENNNLSGSLPSELGLLTGLLNLKLGGNSFSGSIHSELGQLMSLQELDLSDLTLLTGPIASELSSLPSLGWLNLSGSVGVTGTVPDELCFFQNSSCAYVWSTKPCFLAFDCTDQLCGCDCLCSNETSNRNS
ncbi:LRR receptor-like serine threonine-protein kinase [Seminavis robusta]|uniref:LRR receptor-like serine threonine-protein kinase n=1 Tax=Seminavis robusta TaxID=568900 RepID=A0A9N8F0S9_9STRA|nr:LRR receptor-like serine threonine-protein kinase [Seminavis robusta]|eukprot:Sro2506_g329670.1 LRR receptor-like serine threonine-protein kinase (675) ;mRNA; f:4809-7613